MTPAARCAAAIEILDRVMAGAPAERELTGWARGNRFAGSKDRAAIRDLTFDCLRNLRSYAHLSGLPDARGVVIGHMIANGDELSDIFNGVGYGPDTLSTEERDIANSPKADMPRAVSLNIPNWLEPEFTGADDYSLLLDRAPIDLRVNLKKASLKSAAASLLKEGIETDPVDISKTALRVRGQTRKIPQSAAYLNGSIELQDAGSQALVEALDIPQDGAVLDYCAGGGGKTLAMAALATGKTTFDAYDLEPKRLEALRDRAVRADLRVRLLKTDPVVADKRYDLVVLDVPCSGSGSWRRGPDAKWKITPERLDELTDIQAGILKNATGLVTKTGVIAYMTCSVFERENTVQIERFLRENAGWNTTYQRQFNLSDGSDGFYVNVLIKEQL